MANSGSTCCNAYNTGILVLRDRPATRELMDAWHQRLANPDGKEACARVPITIQCNGGGSSWLLMVCSWDTIVPTRTDNADLCVVRML
jgi:hypothetical protein